MPEELRLMCIFAHPDDESLGCGFTLARYAAEGVKTYLAVATRGERGWQGPEEENPGLEKLGKIRERELLKAAMTLGIHEVNFLDYLDGDLNQADPAEAVGKITHLIRRVRPQVVITFDPLGAYGHPDHIAIHQFCMAAVLTAADPTYLDAGGGSAHRVSKVYYMVDTQPLVDLVKEIWGGITMEVDGVTREHTAWPDWVITTRIDASAYWDVGINAIACHATQVAEIIDGMLDLPNTHDPRIFSVQTYFRALSLVNGKEKIETDLFEGLRN
jgi:LmbE family N-acetylglucosaminyl deacetylase